MKWMEPLALSLAILAVVHSQASVTRAAEEVTLEPDKAQEPISPLIYGQFIEHLGNCIYGGLWSEMLLDRKFFFPVTDEFDPWGMASDPQWKAGPFKFLKASPWKVIGPSGTLTMDEKHPYTGKQTPVIHGRQDDTPVGFSQDGLALRAGREYVGRIVLARPEGTGTVQLHLVQDSGKDISQEFAALGDDFRSFVFRFTSSESSDNARIEITARGSGAFAVGAISLMPGDNINGWRADVVALLKELNAPMYRWPGGNFVSGYDWRDGIGERDKRPPRKNPAWRGVEANDVGIHEFMDLMTIIDAAPYVAINTGLGTVDQAVEEVRYLNSPADDAIGKRRAENGHPEPYDVKIFAVGNEMFGGWQLGHMPVEQYVEKHNQVADAIWKVAPEAQLVAVGAPGRWNEQMLRSCAEHMSFMSEHIYSRDKPRVLTHAAQLAEQIHDVAAAYRGYYQRMPAMRERHIRIAMDEWNYWYGDYLYGELGCRYFWKDGLGVAQGLHEFFRNSDLFYLASYAQTVNVLGAIKTNRTAASLESTGVVLKLYRNHFGTIPIHIQEQPDTLDVSAAWTADKSAVTIAVVNSTKRAESVTIKGALQLGDRAHQWLICGDPQAFNEPGKEPALAIRESDVGIQDQTLDAPPFSVVMYRLAKR
jgi:alpha-N-arabinofuranosidase